MWGEPVVCWPPPLLYLALHAYAQQYMIQYVVVLSYRSITVQRLQFEHKQEFWY